MTTTLKPGQPAAVSHGAAGSGVHSRHFPVATADLERVAAAVLDAARKGGATSAETEVSQGIGQSVTVRHAEVETISLQPRQGRERDRLRRAAARQREHGRLQRRIRRRDRRQGDRDRPLHGRGPGGGTRRSGAPRARMAGPRPLSSVGPARRNGDRAGRRDRSRGAGRGPAHHEQRRRDGRAQRIGVRLRELERLRRRLPQFAPSHRLRRDRRGRRRRCSATTGTARRVRRRISTPPWRSGASPASARCAGSMRASWARSNVR